MNRTNKVLFSLSLAAALLASSAVIAPFAHALTVSPVKIEVEADKGATLSEKFTATNSQNEQKTFYTSAENFEAKGESGTPNFTESKEGLASWIQLDKEVIIGAGEDKTIPFTISVPADAEPGGYFAAIFLNTTPPTTKAGEVAVGAKIGVLVFLRISGDIKESGAITGFATANGETFYSHLPVGFVYKFNNAGGDRVQPKGKIAITHLFGWKSASINANAEEGNILPNSTRKFQATWAPKDATAPSGFFATAWYQVMHFAFGRYTATLGLEYGAKDARAESSINFWIIPWQLLVLVGAILIFGTLILRKLVQVWDRHIIAEAQHTMEAHEPHENQ